jgi:hypothetical protein
MGWVEVQLHSFNTSALDEVSGLLYVTAALSQGKDHTTNFLRRWMGLEAGMDDLKKRKITFSAGKQRTVQPVVLSIQSPHRRGRTFNNKVLRLAFRCLTEKKQNAWRKCGNDEFRNGQYYKNGQVKEQQTNATSNTHRKDEARRR